MFFITVKTSKGESFVNPAMIISIDPGEKPNSAYLKVAGGDTYHFDNISSQDLVIKTTAEILRLKEAFEGIQMPLVQVRPPGFNG